MIVRLSMRQRNALRTFLIHEHRPLFHYVERADEKWDTSTQKMTEISMIPDAWRLVADLLIAHYERVSTGAALLAASARVLRGVHDHEHHPAFLRQCLAGTQGVVIPAWSDGNGAIGPYVVDWDRLEETSCPLVPETHREGGLILTTWTPMPGVISVREWKAYDRDVRRRSAGAP